jgi:hypothetical protein
MNILFLGDVVGPPGVALLRALLPAVRAAEGVDLVIANGENVTNGAGLNPSGYRILRTAGVDVVTLGDHVFKKFDIAKVMTNPEEPIVKPANLPMAAPGRDHAIVAVNGVRVAVIALLGRTFMRPVDCPFHAVDRVLATLDPAVKIIIVDIHAEATADKYLMAHHLDGRVTAVLGTHTHVATADEQLLPKGTAFQCDVGMCGPHDGVIGRRIGPVLHTALTAEPTAFDVAAGDVRLNGAMLDVDEVSGRARSIRRVQYCAS